MHYVIERVERMLEELDRLRYRYALPVSTVYKKKTEEAQDPESDSYEGWEIYEWGQIWGGHREYYWFAVPIEIPDSFDGGTAELEIITGREEPREKGEEWGWDATNPQFAAYVNGTLVHGLDINHRDILLGDHVRAGERFFVMLSAFTGDQNFQLQLHALLKLRDQETEDYYFDVSVPFKIARNLEREDKLFLDMVRLLNQSLDLVDLRQPYSKRYYESLGEARRFLEREYYRKYENQSVSEAWCVGHTHIDVAWKWTLKVTRDKVVRSFSTVLDLMEKYPEYKFMSSQPQLYEFLKQEQPEQFERVRERVKEGRWEPEGGMFLEADVVLTSGESLVRQLLYGQRYFEREFGKPSKILWMPDVFGYTAALPQIMKKFGIEYFMTTKIGWNDTNGFPYDTFWWEGLDGSQVLAHMSPARSYLPSWSDKHTDSRYTTYNAYLAPSHLMGGWQRYLQKDRNNRFLAAFGFGDGGGGPTRDELENARRLSRGLAGCPRAVLCTAGEFFKQLWEDVGDDPGLPRWTGEMYMEFHRGVYTSMARNKKKNRKSELLLQSAEGLAAASVLMAGARYPSEALDSCWEILLRNQFHDILPGSAIREVYEDSDLEYERLQKEASEIQNRALQLLSERIDAEEGNLILYNPSGFSGTFLCQAKLNAGEKLSMNGKAVPVQKTGDNIVLFAASLPAKGYAVCRTEAEGKPALDSAAFIREEGGIYHMENQWFSLEADRTGQFTGIYDKTADREVLKRGKRGNVLTCYEDIPCRYDCWNIDQFYEEKFWEIPADSIEIAEQGPVRWVLRLKTSYLESEIEEDVILYRDVRRIDLKFRIHWRQHQLLLKNIFPIDVHTSEAAYEIQFGSITRPTHTNTSWDQARFEVWTHKWLDLSEDGYGVSFFNDCKYGVSVNHTTVGLTLLKSGIFPNPTADQEAHEFTFSIYPHGGGYRDGGTIREAAIMNAVPVVQRKYGQGGQLPNRWSMVESMQENLVVDTVKMAEDGSGIIIRLYESHNRRTNGTLRLGFPVRRAAICNLREEELEEAITDGMRVSFQAAPYEIVTLKLYELEKRRTEV